VHLLESFFADLFLEAGVDVALVQELLLGDEGFVLVLAPLVELQEAVIVSLLSREVWLLTLNLLNAVLELLLGDGSLGVVVVHQLLELLAPTVVEVGQ